VLFCATDDDTADKAISRLIRGRIRAMEGRRR